MAGLDDVVEPMSRPGNLLPVIQYTGSNRDEVRDFLRAANAPVWGNEKEFGTDYGDERTDSRGLPMGEPAIRPGTYLILLPSGRVISTLRVRGRSEPRSMGMLLEEYL